MIYIPIENAKARQELGLTICNAAGDILLSKGTILTDTLIKSIAKQGLCGIYIENPNSTNIDCEIEYIVSPETKSDGVAKLKELANAKEKRNIYKNMADLEKTLGEITKQILSNGEVMGNMVNLHDYDEYTYSHSVNVAILSLVLGTEYGLEKGDLESLGLGAILHDIGKIFLPEKVVNKAGELTASEWELMKTHTKLGYDYAQHNLTLPYSAYQIILDHHERVDGKGYPEGRNGEHTSIYSKIVTIADVYDALTTDRPYRKAVLPSEALEYIMGGMCTAFDEKLVRTFVKRIAPYPIGASVHLSNGDYATVLNCNKNPLRPKIAIYLKDGKLLEEEEEIIDLEEREHLNLTIEEIVSTSFRKESEAE